MPHISVRFQRERVHFFAENGYTMHCYVFHINQMGVHINQMGVHCHVLTLLDKSLSSLHCESVHIIYSSFIEGAYLLTYLLTPWGRILFEKLIVTQLVKKYPAVLRTPKVHHHVHKSPPLDPILRQLNPVRPIDPYLTKVHLNVILPPTPNINKYEFVM
jgi:hypothetical protein